MQMIPLSVWYPSMYDKWQVRLRDLARQGVKTVYPLSERVGWVIHHTVGGVNRNPHAYAVQVADQHWGTWQRPGGYNFLVGEDGLIREMCGYTGQGVHSGTLEWNRKSLGLSFQGDFRSRPPSGVMLDAGGEFIADTSIPSDQWTHREVRPSPTSCPGDALIRLLPLEADPAMKPPDWARAATQWHIDRGIYSGTVNDIDESLEFHRQSVFRHRFYNAIRGEFGSSGSHHHDGRYVKNIVVSR